MTYERGRPRSEATTTLANRRAGYGPVDDPMPFVIREEARDDVVATLDQRLDSHA